jgi:hypothetical protein
VATMIIRTERPQKGNLDLPAYMPLGLTYATNREVVARCTEVPTVVTARGTK